MSVLGPPTSTYIDVGGDGPVVVHRSSEPARREELRRRGALVDRLNHPGLVEVVAVVDGQGSTELRTRWAGGGTLARLGAGQATRRWRLLSGVATTLADLHDRGVVHGRLDPSHVLVDRSGSVLLCAPRGEAVGLDPTVDLRALAALITAPSAASPGGRRVGRRRAVPSTARRLAADLEAGAADARQAAATLAEMAVRGTRRPGRRSRAVRGGLVLVVAVAAATGVAAVAGVHPRVHRRARAPLPARRCAGPAGGSAASADSGGDEHLVVADVDGDGCTEPVRIHAGRVIAGRRRYRIGRPGDVATIGDWDGDGMATPALVRPATGEVFVFPRWPSAGRPLGVEPVAVVQWADGVAARPAGGHDVLVVDRAGAAPVPVALPTRPSAEEHP